MSEKVTIFIDEGTITSDELLAGDLYELVREGMEGEADE